MPHLCSAVYNTSSHLHTFTSWPRAALWDFNERGHFIEVTFMMARQPWARGVHHSLDSGGQSHLRVPSRDVTRQTYSVGNAGRKLHFGTEKQARVVGCRLERGREGGGEEGRKEERSEEMDRTTTAAWQEVCLSPGVEALWRCCCCIVLYTHTHTHIKSCSSTQ